MLIVQDKNHRQHKILGLIKSKKLSTQSELVELLEDAGFEATQSSVSRDLDELGIMKARGFYVAPGNSDAQTTVQGMKSLQKAGDSLLVIRCEAGFASALSVAIDQASIKDIAGTIAGDDTIFIAVDGKAAQTKVHKILSDLFYLIKE